MRKEPIGASPLGRAGTRSSFLSLYFAVLCDFKAVCTYYFDSLKGNYKTKYWDFRIGRDLYHQSIKVLRTLPDVNAGPHPGASESVASEEPRRLLSTSAEEPDENWAVTNLPGGGVGNFFQSVHNSRS